MRIGMQITFTNFVGAATMFIAMNLNLEYAFWGGVVLVLGRKAIPEITDMIKAYKGRTK
jgi:hypothetical protein